MTLKKVWGVIIIVVGIFMVFNGATKIYEADFYGNEIKVMEQQFSKYGNTNLLDTGRYLKIMKQEKENGTYGILLGIALSIGGTLLISKKEEEKAKESTSSYRNKDGGWSF